MVVTVGTDGPIDFDDDDISLREAIAITNGVPGLQEITFDPSVTLITLSGDEFEVTDSLTITGPGADLLTITGELDDRFFEVDDHIESLSITGISFVNSDSDEILEVNGLVNDLLIDGVVFDNVNIALELDVVNATISNSLFIGSTRAIDLDEGNLLIINSTFTGHTSSRVIDVDDSQARIVNSTIFANQGTGIEVDDGGTVELINTILAQNGDGSFDDNGGDGTITSLGGNLSDDDGGGFLTAAGDQTNTNPLLGPLADNGGPTITLALLPGSPAIDAGGADVLITPVGVVSATAATDFGSADLLFSIDPLTLQNFRDEVEMGNFSLWGTDDFNLTTGGGDYFDGSNPNPVLTFDLGESQFLSDIVVWGNQSFANSDVKDFTIELSNDGGTTFGDPIMFTKERSDIEAVSVFPIGGVADTVRLTVTDNYFVEGEDFGAGVALHEVRFLGNTLATDQRGDGFPRQVDGNGDGIARVDVGAFEIAAPFLGDLIVSTNSDIVDGDHSDGELSLREAINAANQRTGADDITFAESMNGQTITLTEGQFQLFEEVTITGPGAGIVTVDANDLSRHFFIDNGTAFNVTIDGLTLSNGNVNDGNGGSILTTQYWRIDGSKRRLPR